MKLEIKIKKRNGVSLPDVVCEEIKDRFEVSDNRGDLSMFNAFWFQFWAHQSINTKDGGRINLYDGLDNGQGVYGPSMNRGDLVPVILLPSGYFRLTRKGLPYVHGTHIELTGDMHRANENWALKALHLMAAKIHNRRMDAHGDFDLAKDETIATLNTVTLNELIELTGLSFDQIFNNIKIENLHQGLESPNAIARWAHLQMPDTVAGKPVFDKRYSGEVDVALMLTEKSRAFSLGVSSAMQNMTHLPAEPHKILERTFAKHVELGLPCHQDACDATGLSQGKDEAPQGCPLFAAMGMTAINGRPNEMYSRLIADIVAGSLKWGEKIGQGIWHPRWDGAPNTSADIVDYAFSG